MEPANRTLGDGRFELLDSLGSGSFGAVYRARDRAGDTVVALKLLHKSDPSSLLRFKAEFRAVSDLVHPNLVRLHELHRDGDLWFFTMELVPGASLDVYVRPAGELQQSRLVGAYGQVAQALAALHSNGQVHRDVKPNNVRVDPSGRAVLLDFGLAASVASDLDGRTRAGGQSSGAFVGSPYYMSPEQAMGEPPQPASDWYSFGVCLYESLTGRRPFEGRPLEVLVDKRQQDAPSPPDDAQGMGELVGRLLARDPLLRPTADEVLAFFKQNAHPVDSPPRSTFVGRQEELAQLAAAARASHAGAPTTIWLEAPPGVGKTALLERFWAALPPETLVIHGRCYEQESVPYKGMDAAVDHLTRCLCNLPERELHTFAAGRVAALVAVFPVLARVPSFAALDHQVGYEPAQLRMEAFAALRELLHLLARHRPVVFLLDDMQWLDADGAALLGDLLQPPTGAPMLFVGALRPPERSAAPWLDALRREVPGTTLHLLDLSMENATELADHLLGGATERSARVACASSGNPLLLEMLVRYGDADSNDLTSTMRRCFDGLESSERRLLEVTCLAGHPLPQHVVARASGTSPDAVAALAAKHLVTVGRDGDTRLVAPYHDRVREALVAQLDGPRRAALHSRLAQALTEHDGDPEAVALHHQAAGETELAARWVELAAGRAGRALAWDRAAQLYTRAIRLRQSSGESGAELWIARGKALGHMGHGGDSAHAFRQALEELGGEQAPLATRVDLLHRMSEQLLRCGRMKDGVSILEEALSAVGLRYPRRPAVALASLLSSRAQLKLRGLEFTPRAEENVSPLALQRIDLCWSAGVGLSFIDSIRGASFLSRSLQEALDAGEPYRVARSLAYEACYLANRGPAGERVALDMVRRTRRMAQELDEPHIHALAYSATCLVAFHNGRWRAASDAALTASNTLREHSVGIVKEIASIQITGLAAQVFTGDFVGLAERLPPILRAAEIRGDLFSLASKRSGFINALWLAQDEPTLAREQAERAMVGWESEGYVIQHFFDLWARTQINLYEGDGVAAAARVAVAGKAFRRSTLTRLPFLRGCADDLMGRAGLADPGAQRGLPLARAGARALAKQGVPWTDGLADALNAGVTWREKGPSAAVSLLARAAIRFERADMESHVAAMILARSQCARGRLASDLEREASDRFARCGVVDARRWTTMLFPALAFV